MKKLSEEELLFVRLVAKQYYEVIPEKYKTFCVFNAQVLAKIFQHYGLDSEIIPCQTLLSEPSSSTLIGFVGSNPGVGGWDGHAICRVGDYYIDASVHHFAERLADKKIDVALFKNFDWVGCDMFVQLLGELRAFCVDY